MKVLVLVLIMVLVGCSTQPIKIFTYDDFRGISNYCSDLDNNFVHYNPYSGESCFQAEARLSIELKERQEEKRQEEERKRQEEKRLKEDKVFYKKYKTHLCGDNIFNPELDIVSIKKCALQIPSGYFQIIQKIGNKGYLITYPDKYVTNIYFIKNSKKIIIGNSRSCFNCGLEKTIFFRNNNNEYLKYSGNLTYQTLNGFEKTVAVFEIYK